MIEESLEDYEDRMYEKGEQALYHINKYGWYNTGWLTWIDLPEPLPNLSFKIVEKDMLSGVLPGEE